MGLTDQPPGDLCSPLTFTAMADVGCVCATMLGQAHPRQVKDAVWLELRERFFDSRRVVRFLLQEKIADDINLKGVAGSEKPKIVVTDDFEIKPMSSDEASMQLDLSDKPFMVFSNALTNKINVIYKRNDGDHGLIEPDFK